MKRNLKFKIGPGLEIDASFSNFVTRANIRNLKKRAFEVDRYGDFVTQIRADEFFGGASLGDMTNSIMEKVEIDIDIDRTIRDSEDQNIEVDFVNRSRAFRYGSDFIPVNKFDEDEIKMHSDVSMAILGYIDNTNIPRASFIDSAYAITGGGGDRGKVAISSLAQALDEMKQAAVVRFVKTKDSDPIIGVLLPLEATANSTSFAKKGK